MPKNYMVGNWKMNHNLSEVDAFFSEVLDAKLPAGNFWIAPQSIHLKPALDKVAGPSIKIGAQNCSNHDFGAFTGETSATSLKDLGAHFVIIGHSERRSLFAEDDQVINAKVKKAISCGLVPILCIGETLQEREAGKTLDVVLGQLKAGLAGVKLQLESDLIIAYEPVWAIGTGKTATPEQAEEVHAEIRKALQQLYGDLGTEFSILYGGSVKPDNIVELLSKPNINGGLVGGASLKAKDYLSLCRATL